MTRAEEAALNAYPIKGEWVGNQYGEWDNDINKPKRNAFLQGYEQAEKDLTLTLELVVKLDCLIMNMDEEGYNDGYKTRPFYEEVLRRFNEQRKK